MVLEIKRSYYSLLTIAGDDMASPALNNSKLILSERQTDYEVILKTYFLPLGFWKVEVTTEEIVDQNAHFQL